LHAFAPIRSLTDRKPKACNTHFEYGTIKLQLDVIGKGLYRP